MALPRRALAPQQPAYGMGSFQPWLHAWQLLDDLSLAVLRREGRGVTLGPISSTGDTFPLSQPSFACLPCKCTSSIFISAAFLRDDGRERPIREYAPELQNRKVMVLSRLNKKIASHFPNRKSDLI